MERSEVVIGCTSRGNSILTSSVIGWLYSKSINGLAASLADFTRSSSGLTTLGPDDPGDDDAQKVEHDHRRREDRLVHRDRPWRDDGGDDEDDEDGVLEVASQRKRAVTSFIFARKKTTVGIWKTMPIPRSIFA